MKLKKIALITLLMTLAGGCKSFASDTFLPGPQVNILLQRCLPSTPGYSNYIPGDRVRRMERVNIVDTDFDPEHYVIFRYDSSQYGEFSVDESHANRDTLADGQKLSYIILVSSTNSNSTSEKNIWAYYDADGGGELYGQTTGSIKFFYGSQDDFGVKEPTNHDSDEYWNDYSKYMNTMSSSKNTIYLNADSSKMFKGLNLGYDADIDCVYADKLFRTSYNLDNGYYIDTQYVTDYTEMFFGCVSGDTPLDIDYNAFKYIRCTSTKKMFYYVKGVSTNVGSNFDNTINSNCDTTDMFYTSSYYNDMLSFSGLWYAPNHTNYTNMLYERAEDIRNLDLRFIAVDNYEKLLGHGMFLNLKEFAPPMFKLMSRQLVENIIRGVDTYTPDLSNYPEQYWDTRPAGRGDYIMWTVQGDDTHRLYDWKEVYAVYKEAYDSDKEITFEAVEMIEPIVKFNCSSTDDMDKLNGSELIINLNCKYGNFTITGTLNKDGSKLRLDASEKIPKSMYSISNISGLGDNYTINNLSNTALDYYNYYSTPVLTIKNLHKYNPKLSIDKDNTNDSYVITFGNLASGIKVIDKDNNETVPTGMKLEMYEGTGDIVGDGVTHSKYTENLKKVSETTLNSTTGELKFSVDWNTKDADARYYYLVIPSDQIGDYRLSLDHENSYYYVDGVGYIVPNAGDDKYITNNVEFGKHLITSNPDKNAYNSVWCIDKDEETAENIVFNIHGNAELQVTVDKTSNDASIVTSYNANNSDGVNLDTEGGITLFAKSIYDTGEAQVKISTEVPAGKYGIYDADKNLIKEVETDDNNIIKTVINVVKQLGETITYYIKQLDIFDDTLNVDDEFKEFEVVASPSELNPNEFTMVAKGLDEITFNNPLKQATPSELDKKDIEIEVDDVRKETVDLTDYKSDAAVTFNVLEYVNDNYEDEYFDRLLRTSGITSKYKYTFNNKKNLFIDLQENEDDNSLYDLSMYTDNNTKEIEFDIPESIQEELVDAGITDVAISKIEVKFKSNSGISTPSEIGKSTPSEITHDNDDKKSTPSEIPSNNGKGNGKGNGSNSGNTGNNDNNGETSGNESGANIGNNSETGNVVNNTNKSSNSSKKNKDDEDNRPAYDGDWFTLDGKPLNKPVSKAGGAKFKIWQTSLYVKDEKRILPVHGRYGTYRTYLFNHEGQIVYGWAKDPKTHKWHYFNDEGAELYGWQFINGKWYFFNDDMNDINHGDMLSNCTYKGYKLGEDGALIEN